jgi:hypothetical protein
MGAVNGRLGKGSRLPVSTHRPASQATHFLSRTRYRQGAHEATNTQAAGHCGPRPPNRTRISKYSLPFPRVRSGWIPPHRQRGAIVLRQAPESAPLSGLMLARLNAEALPCATSSGTTLGAPRRTPDPGRFARAADTVRPPAAGNGGRALAGADARTRVAAVAPRFEAHAVSETSKIWRRALHDELAQLIRAMILGGELFPGSGSMNRPCVPVSWRRAHGFARPSRFPPQNGGCPTGGPWWRASSTRRPMI